MWLKITWKRPTVLKMAEKSNSQEPCQKQNQKKITPRNAWRNYDQIDTITAN